MKSTPFDSATDIAPIPFSTALKIKAKEMKDAGLVWHPQTGCFVWDEQNKIQVSSPFPENIYFVLNLNHFLKIFGSLEEMQRQLVWIPTWYQAVILLKLCGDLTQKNDITDREEDSFIYLYNRIIKNLFKR